MQAEENEKKGKLRVAVEDYKAALALDPDHVAHNVHLHFGLCKLLVRLGRGKDALNACTEVLTIDEEHIEALVQVFNITLNIMFVKKGKRNVNDFHNLSESNFSEG